jgi:hypothetical protein
MKKQNETILHNVITYIRSANIGDIIFRRNLIDFGGQTVDNYRNYLTKAGYLRTKHTGAYEYIKKIPANMTYDKLIKEAYPNSEWSGSMPRK